MAKEKRFLKDKYCAYAYVCNAEDYGDIYLYFPLDLENPRETQDFCEDDEYECRMSIGDADVSGAEEITEEEFKRLFKEAVASYLKMAGIDDM